MRILAVAAHPDDLALSLGGLLFKLRSRATLRGFVAFGRSRYSRRNFELNGRNLERLRHAEETAFARMIGMRIRIDDLPDTSCRGVDDFTPRRHSSGARELHRQVVSALRQEMAQFPPSALLAPAGIGRHADHIAIRDAALSLQRWNLPVILYEDLPYSIGRPSDAAVPRGRRVIVPVDDCIHRKARALLLYDSQLARLQIARVIEHASVRGQGGPAECLYALDACAWTLLRRLCGVRSGLRAKRIAARPP